MKIRILKALLWLVQKVAPLLLNVLVPSVLWTLAVVNGIAIAWTQSGTAFGVSISVVGIFALGSAIAAPLAVSALQKHVAVYVRVIVYGMALIGLFAEMRQLIPDGWLPGEEVVEVVPPIVPATVDLDNDIKMYVPPSPPRSPDLPPDLLGAIEKGERMMEKANFDPDHCLGTGKGFEKCLGSYLLAAVNKNGSLQEVEVMLAPDGSFVSTPASFSVDKESGGGFNSAFRVSSPPGWTVVALRRPYRKDGGVTADTYIPYSPNLDTDELVAEGTRYFGLMLTSASRELEARHVESKFLDGKLVTDIGTNDHVAALVMTEWVRDPQEFVSGNDAVRAQLVTRTLAMFGANRGRAFRFGQSATGALGIAQVMPGTADGIIDQYDDAGLVGTNDFDRIDHQQALKMSILHADAELWVFNRRDRDDRDHLRQLLADARTFRLVLASGYNCNFDVVDAIIHARGADWRKPCPAGDASCRALPLETRQYLEKYEDIYDLLFDRATHDRVAAIVHPPVVVETKTE